ncbi:MAG TPA: CPBP family intramembrane glutamic endopeptidase [Gammaproteobacteria bacterium]|nr:CPBP family intramembrane glutamic endopeptidase [Gammaproteobacteria bacterium]
MTATSVADRKAAWILAGIALIEGSVVALNAILNPAALIRVLGFTAGRAGSEWGWLLAMAVTTGFVWHSRRFPAVREHMLRVSWFKLLALAVAVSAGILEEAVFRRQLMNSLQLHGWGTMAQILASGLAFGLVHGIWGLFGRNLRAAAGATIATGLLGLALAAIYVASGRSLAPCVATHFAIDLLIEPGIMLAACRGEMSGIARAGAAKTPRPA